MLQICAAIYERFKAQRELSETMDAALTFVATWPAFGQSPGIAGGAGYEARGTSGCERSCWKDRKAGKLMAWWKAESDKADLEECVSAVRETMRDTSFGASVEIAGKLDGLRSQVTDLKDLLGANMEELRAELATGLGMSAGDLDIELDQVLANQRAMLRNQAGMKDYLVELRAGMKELRQQQQAGETLEVALSPLRSLDNAVINDNLSRFAEGTRQWAIERFDEWVSSGFQDHRVFVLTAGAGVGKTGIMCKLARERSEIVAAYHFCRHDDPTRRGDPKRMLCSLAYQLAQAMPAYRAELEKLRLTRADLADSTLFTVTGLFAHLFEGPFGELATAEAEKAAGEGRGPSHRVILIDALDECEHGGRNDILQCIKRNFRKLPPWLGVYLTTRPEAPIMEALRAGKLKPQELVPESEENLQDLRIFFRRVLEPHRSLITEVEIAAETLVGKARGLFVYAAMAAEHVDRLAHRGGQLSLDSIRDMPEGLDDFYDLQMDRLLGAEGTEALEWRAVRLATVAREPLHVETLRTFLGCSDQQRRRAVARLSRFFPIRDRKLHAYHKSVRDWLVREERRDVSSGLFVDVRDAEAEVAARCLEALESVRAQHGVARGVGGEQHPETMAYARNGVQHCLRRSRARMPAGSCWIWTGCSRDAVPERLWKSARIAEPWRNGGDVA